MGEFVDIKPDPCGLAYHSIGLADRQAVERFHDIQEANLARVHAKGEATGWPFA